jgi:excisionase family DNA binding protein
VSEVRLLLTLGEIMAHYGTLWHGVTHWGTSGHKMSSNIRIKRICQHCEQEFIARTTVTKYCSDGCSKRAYKARVRGKKIDKSNSETKLKLIQPTETLKAKEFLSIKEVCQLIGISRRSVYRLIESGQINIIKVGSRTIIKRSSLNQFISISEFLPDKETDLPKNGNGSSDFDIENGYTLKEVQENFNISQTGLQLLIKREKIPKIRKGRFAYLPKSIIENLLT